MKKVLKMCSYLLATLMVLLVFQFSGFASGGTPIATTSMTGLQVLGGFVILALVILLPLLKAESKDKIA